MDSSVSLSNQALEHPGMDFAFLRKEGIEHIQRLIGNLWTDYNSHDPGITILEYLCYAITDLSYRLSFPVEDILAASPTDFCTDQHFFTAREILTSNPLTINDYRKLIIDIKEVKNAWLEINKIAISSIFYDKSQHLLYFSNTEASQELKLNGLYRVLVEKEENITIDDLSLTKIIKNKLHQYRNVCEDFSEIKILPVETVSIKLDLVINPGTSIEKLFAKIYFALSRFIAPIIHSCSLEEMLRKGKSIEEIYSGPALENGFIDDDEIDNFRKKEALYSSDIIAILLNMEEIKAVKKILLSSNISQTEQIWSLKLDREYTPKLKLLDAVLSSQDIKFFIQQIECSVDPKNLLQISQVKTEFKKLVDADPVKIHGIQDIPIPAGKYRNLADYTSIQHDFPLNYGIGKVGLPDSASNQRKAQAKQLKAYLLFFDQLLANYFSQLNQIKVLLSFHSDSSNPIIKTYFGQALKNVPGIESLLKDSSKNYEELLEDIPTKIDRKNRVLDHMLAAFSEQFTDYAMMQYDKYLSDTKKAPTIRLKNNSTDDSEKMACCHIENKIDFLKNYPKISASRSRSFNYLDKTNTLDSEKNYPGLKSRISKLLGIKNFSAVSLSEEGFHIVEHILLRRTQMLETTSKEFLRIAKDRPSDPYSFQISFIFPTWPKRFSDSNFKNFIYEVLLNETPAHILFYIHWFDNAQMTNFEAIYKDWLTQMANENAIGIVTASNQLLSLLKIGTLEQKA